MGILEVLSLDDLSKRIRERNSDMLELKKIASNVKIGGKGPFELYALDNFDFCENLEFKEEKGIYMFTNRKVLDNGSIDHEIYYIGQTTKYDQRFYHHHKEKQLKNANPNCLAICECKESEMDQLEKDLVLYWKPEYNEKLKDASK